MVGADAAFYGVFGIFAAAFVVLVVVTLRWAVRRDRAGREAWLRRRQDAPRADPRSLPPPRTNGRPPPAPRGRGRGERRPPGTA